MKNTFLKYLNNWEQQCQSIHDKSSSEKASFCLSKQTLEGIRITGIYMFNRNNFFNFQQLNLFEINELLKQQVLKNGLRFKLKKRLMVFIQSIKKIKSKHIFFIINSRKFSFILLVHSFITLSKILFEEGVEFILSEKFCQDPLEEYFGKQRMRLGCNENPTLEQYNFSSLALTVAGDNLIRVAGNTRGRKDVRPELSVHDTTLPPIKKLKR